MREIKFRGKRIDNNEWVYGFYSPLIWYPNLEQTPSIKTIGQGDKEVGINTVGQYTGLKDKNGKEIFEGDIVKVNGVANAEINYDEDSAKFTFFWGADGMPLCVINSNERSMEVIGNVYDNPELLKEIR